MILVDFGEGREGCEGKSHQQSIDLALPTYLVGTTYTGVISRYLPRY